MKGKQYEIIDDWKIPDFSLIQRNELTNIKNSFRYFTLQYGNKESEEFRNVLLDYVKNNFKIIINDFIPYNGKNFFDKFFNYNKIHKIQSLYNNIKYSINQTLSFYIEILKIYPDIIIPEDLKSKILSLKNLTLKIKSKNTQMLSLLNYKINQIFNETTKDCIEKYISFLQNDVYLKLNFDNRIISIIGNILNNDRIILEKEYSDMINIYIKNTLLEKYINYLNKESNDIITNIENNLKNIKIEFNKKKTLNRDIILKENIAIIEKITKNIIIYNSSNFQLSNVVLKYLNEYSSKKIIPLYEEIYLILLQESKDYLFMNLEKNSNKYKKSYIIEDFIKKSNKVNVSLSEEYFEKMNKYIFSYGDNENNYLKNLNKEIIKFENKENIKNNKINLKLDEALEKLKNSSHLINEFIQNSLFQNFDETIKKYMNTIKLEYVESQDIIKKYEYDNQTNIKINNKLNELKQYAIDYYININSKYFKIKEYIKNYIIKINKLIEIFTNISYETISNEFIKIKNDYNQVNKLINKEEKVNIEEYIWKGEEDTYKIKTEIDKYFHDNEIIFDIIFENEDKRKPKIIGKIINKNRPKRLLFDIFPLYGNGCVKVGTKISTYFNNISLLVDFSYESYSNSFNINTSIDFDEYEISYNKYYEKEQKIIIKKIAGIDFIINLCFGEGGSSKSKNDIKVKVINGTKINTTENFIF